MSNPDHPAHPIDHGLEVVDLRVCLAATTVLDDLSLAVAPGEIVAVLGPSGSGKSTLLRTIGGLIAPAAGTIRWQGADLAAVPAHRRGFGLMFQDHALFTHRDVGANIEFGLKMAGATDDARRTRVHEMLDLVGLTGFTNRSVHSLSGGEAQRVALARALAPSPQLLMLDEPLGSLDRALRERLTLDIRGLLRGLHMTAVHVTHDQEEAFVIADRVAIMLAGRVVRVDTPHALWNDPGSEQAARLLGHRNIVDLAERGRVLVRDDAISVGDHGPLVLDATIVSQHFSMGRFRTSVVTNLGPLTFDSVEPLAANAAILISLDPTKIVNLSI